MIKKGEVFAKCVCIIMLYILEYIYIYGGGRGVLFIIGNKSSNPGQGCFTFHVALGKGMDPIILTPTVRI